MGFGNDCDGCVGDNGIAIQLCSKCFDRYTAAVKHNIKDEKGRYDITCVDHLLEEKEDE